MNQFEDPHNYDYVKKNYRDVRKTNCKNRVFKNDSGPIGWLQVEEFQ